MVIVASTTARRTRIAPGSAWPLRTPVAQLLQSLHEVPVAPAVLASRPPRFLQHSPEVPEARYLQLSLATRLLLDLHLVHDILEVPAHPVALPVPVRLLPPPELLVQSQGYGRLSCWDPRLLGTTLGCQQPDTAVPDVHEMQGWSPALSCRPSSALPARSVCQRRFPDF